MPKKKLLAALVTCALCAAFLGVGCSGESSESSASGESATLASTGTGTPAAMPADHEGRFQSLGANGCYGCHGSSESAEVMLADATALPADHYENGDVTTRQIDASRAECITCHVVDPEK